MSVPQEKSCIRPYCVGLPKFSFLNDVQNPARYFTCFRRATFSERIDISKLCLQWEMSVVGEFLDQQFQNEAPILSVAAPAGSLRSFSFPHSETGELSFPNFPVMFVMSRIPVASRIQLEYLKMLHRMSISLLPSRR